MHNTSDFNKSEFVLHVPSVVLLINNISNYLHLVIFTFGLFGNVLTVFVLRTKRFQQTSTGIYLTVLAIIDLFYLICSLLILIINFIWIFPNKLKDLSSVACVLISYFQYTLTYISVWLLVSVSVDRAVWVSLPFRAKYICTIRNAWIVIISIIIFFCFINFHFFWTMNYTHTGIFNKSTIIKDNNLNSLNNYSYFQCLPSYFTINIFPYIDLILACILPSVVMLISNFLIGYYLKRMDQKHGKIAKNSKVSKSKNTSKNHKSWKNLKNDEFQLKEFEPIETNQQYLNDNSYELVDEKSQLNYLCPANPDQIEMKQSILKNSNFDKQSVSNFQKFLLQKSLNKHNSFPNRFTSLTTMLLAINIFFLVTTCPLLIYDVLFFAFELKEWISQNETKRGPIVFAIERIVYTLWYTNFAVHFLLYCLSGPQFRAQVKTFIQTNLCNFFRKKPIKK